MIKKISFHLEDCGIAVYIISIFAVLLSGVLFEKVSLSIVGLVLFFMLLLDKGHIKVGEK